MEVPFSDTLRSQPRWVLLLLSLGLFQVSRLSLSFLRWIYTFFLRPPKHLLDYGQWAIITGPTDGIGKAMAFELARQGLSLILVGRNPDKLKSVSAAIQAELRSVEVVTVVFDLAGDIPNGVRRLKMAIENLDVGVLVNNAGVCYDAPKYLHELEEKMYTDLVKVNMESLTEITRAVLPQMVRKKKGAIANLGSGSVVILPSYPMFAVYTATKGYVDALSRSLHYEYKSSGIDIHCQTPAFAVTKMVPDKRHSFFNSTPEEYAPPAVRAVGYGTSILPYWRHSMLNFLAKLAPERILNEWFLRDALNQR
ncbi:unnamed protein product [Spirodela intermedia]|uniref:Uncharacterized protein n=1 Tax=Spirodela intermedia TaxID=51605 RepID=A0A7I8JC26_SPIIN|nr:unnamed protein product [Spirodela intermedia]CAA6667674.1 unnamed protein product [Spirodela intermedia]